jgi:uncharacterized repeat protein (TIGR01451 family)
MQEQKSVTTERRAVRGAALTLLAASLSAAGLLPRPAAAMTADGALITNVASATLYWGSGSFFPVRGGVTSQGFTMSYRVTANVLVSCPFILPQKWVTPTTQAAGGTVTFTICVTNNSLLASAWGVILTDRLPDNMVAPTAAPLSTSLLPPGTTLTSSYSSDNVTYSGTGPAAAGQASPYYLRWAFDKIGPGRSACIYFQARVI